MSRAKRNGRIGGAMMMFGMFFATLFDPKKAASVEHIMTQRRIGNESDRAAVTANTPPGDGVSRD